ncbi:hypothetical protein BXOR1_13490 [Xanthomonas oryzae pv. oryzicola]|nr:hypothetical protein FE36_20415 [Xanthomonas oryzae pv. oryzicola]OLK88018.1 hypothetical protein BXOR1_13490 [Xanthomonas oryzae pv. oryzicola]
MLIYIKLLFTPGFAIVFSCIKLNKLQPAMKPATLFMLAHTLPKSRVFRHTYVFNLPTALINQRIYGIAISISTREIRLYY